MRPRERVLSLKTQSLFANICVGSFVSSLWRYFFSPTDKVSFSSFLCFCGKSISSTYRFANMNEGIMPKTSCFIPLKRKKIHFVRNLICLILGLEYLGYLIMSANCIKIFALHSLFIVHCFV